MSNYPNPKLFKPSKVERQKAAERLVVESMKGRNDIFKKKIKNHAEN